MRAPLLVFLLACLASLQSVPAPGRITVSAAVSLTDALTAVAAEYTRVEHRAVRFNFAGSNVLARQITSGAPVDLFISADEDQMNVVATAGMVKDNSRVDLLANQLAVVVPSDRPRTFHDMRDLTDPSLKRIALGDPEAVPAGVYAKAFLQKQGLWDALAPRTVPFDNVRGALEAVESGAADAAIVYRTDARMAKRATVAWVVSPGDGPKIRYPAAVMVTSTHPVEASRFMDFLRGEAAAAIFERYGFTPLH